MIKTVKIKELYSFIKQSNMFAYIESEAALIKMIKQMTCDRPGSAVCFHFVDIEAKEFVFRVHLKDLEN